MSKRFKDTNIWDQTWFLELSPESKTSGNSLRKVVTARVYGK
jgi:hypothetical protein